MSERNDLSARLDQYAITAKGQIAGGRGVGEIAGYAAAVGAGLAMAGTADASIVYSGVQNISATLLNPNATSTLQTASIDIDGDAAPDARLVAFAANTGTGTKYAAGLGGVFAVGGAQLSLASTALGYPFAVGANVPASHSVGPGGTFGSGKYLGGILAVENVASTAYKLGNFALGVTGVAGIRLASGNYGWIRLRIDDLGPNQPFGGTKGLGFPDRVTAIDWAYEDSGGSIHVPAPTPLALLAAGAAGIGALRRRKAEQAKP